MKTVARDEQAVVSFTLNGRPARGLAAGRMLLSDFLREVCGATGTHVGCEHGVCGCCTVLIDGKASRACLMLAVQAEGRSIETVESLAGEGGALNPLQAALKDRHALQCGFCTPGILMSFTEFLRKVPNPSRQDVTDVLSGHLCRCTGYADIVEAVMDAAAANARKGANP